MTLTSQLGTNNSELGLNLLLGYAPVSGIVLPRYTGLLGYAVSVPGYGLMPAAQLPSGGFGTFFRTASQSLIFTEAASRSMIRQLSIAQTLTFVSVGSPGPARVRQQLTLSQIATAVRLPGAIASNTLTFTQSAVLTSIRHLSVSQTLNLVQSSARQMVYGRSVSQQLVFRQYYPKNLALGLVYNVPQAVITVHRAGQRNYVVLQTSDSVITLPAPILGDGVHYDSLSVIVKRSINNQVYSYARTNDLQRLRYSFILGRLKSLELRQFVEKSVGKPITLGNWKGDVWLVYLTNDPTDFVPKSRYDLEQERVEVVLEFEGVKVLAGNEVSCP